MYGLYVNGTMISYVRKDKGLKKKRDNSRTVDKENVNRIPSKDRYNAIVEAMKHFDMI